MRAPQLWQSVLMGSNAAAPRVHFSSRAMLVKAFLAGLLLSGCTTAPRFSAGIPSVQLPNLVFMNKGAGDGWHFLVVPVRLENGETLPFIVDTGAPGTCFDKSLEPKLGKRLGTQRIITPAGTATCKETTSIYAAPKLYLGNICLVTGKRVGTIDLSGMSSADCPIRGVLGMDCLRHYCLQLDFQAGKIHFLDPENPAISDLGTPIPLLMKRGVSWVDRNILGEEASRACIDTGCNIDGTLKPAVFQREVRERKGQPALLAESGVITGFYFGTATFRESVWYGQTYTNLIVDQAIQNLIGLRFLTRHQVTFNFPKRMMYLKRASSGFPGRFPAQRSVPGAAARKAISN